MMSFNLPQIIAHADWGLQPRKRQAVHAVWQEGRYYLHPPQPAAEPLRWLRRLHAAAAPGALLVGLDFPIGLPLAYADKVGFKDFLSLLPRLSTGEWRDFYRVAVTKEEIGLKRPFYPYRPGGTRQRHLLEGLGVAHMNDLRRRCDLPQPDRRAAAPLFWTLGAQQVGKAALCGWRKLLVPALQDPALDAVIWPFSGTLEALHQPNRIILAETYPAEFYNHLGVNLRRRSKRRQADRQANADVLLGWARQNDVMLDPALQQAIADGFGPKADGEDAFDATIGVTGMINLVLGKRPFAEPQNDSIRQVEGWILGQAVSSG